MQISLAEASVSVNCTLWSITLSTLFYWTMLCLCFWDRLYFVEIQTLMFQLYLDHGCVEDLVSVHYATYKLSPFGKTRPELFTSLSSSRATYFTVSWVVRPSVCVLNIDAKSYEKA